MKSVYDALLFWRAQKGRSRFRRACSSDDVVTLLTLVMLWLLALVFPRPTWPTLVDGCARLHRRLRRPSHAATVECLHRAGVDASDRAMAQELLAGNYLENLETVASYVPWRSAPEIDVRGTEHIARSLERGRGVILWHSPFCAAALIEKLGYRCAGLAVTHLRDQAHPYSGTAFGLRVLNPVRTRVEDRGLAGVAWLLPGGARDALTRLGNLLRANGIVSVTAIGSGRNAIDTPLLGGTLSLARGVPSLAERTGAAVIPTVVTILTGATYRVEFGPPLEVGTDLAGDTFQQALVDAYAERLACRLRDHPGNWRGWSMSHTWRP